MKLKFQLPRVYEKLWDQDLLRMDPTETKATCDDCAMARPKNRRKIFYEKDLKCCTFYPFIPNYAVGALFAHPEHASFGAMAHLREKIARRRYSLPIGMIPPVSYQVRFNARRENEFGRREDWLCPYYNKEQQNCGIWRHRGSVCSSFYCQSSYGAKGLKFWDELSNYMSYVEMALMEEALAMLDFSPRQVSDLLGYINRKEGTQAELKSSVIPEKKARELWNGYYDDQEGFFKKSFEIVSNLDKRSFQELLGETGERLEENLRKAYQKICP